MSSPRRATYHASERLSGAGGLKFDTRDDPVGLLLNPHDSPAMQRGGLGPHLAYGDFVLGTELDPFLENDAQPAAAHVERPPLEGGRRANRDTRSMQAGPSRLQGDPRAQLVTRPTPPRGMDVTRGHLRQGRQATTVFHGQTLMIAACPGIPQYHA